LGRKKATTAAKACLTLQRTAALPTPSAHRNRLYHAQNGLNNAGNESYNSTGDDWPPVRQVAYLQLEGNGQKLPANKLDAAPAIN